MAISFDINTLVAQQKKKQPVERTVGVLHPKSTIENDIKGAMSSIARGENEDNLMAAYPSLRGKWGDILGYMNDFESGSGKQELIKAYPTMPKRISDELFGDEEDSNVVKNIGEGVVSFAGGLPKIIAKTGLLDKPAEALAQGVGSALRFLGANIASKEEIARRSELNSFSKGAKGSQVGGDVESQLAKNVETGLDTVALVAGIPQIVKGLTKAAAKRAVKNISKEIAEGKSGQELLKNRTFRKLWTSIQPKQTSSTIAKKGGRVLRGDGGEAIIGRTAPSLLRKGMNVPTKTDLSRIKTVIDAGVQKGDSLETMGDKFAKAIQNSEKQADKLIKNKNKIFNVSQIEKRFKEIEKVPSDITPANKKKIQNIFLEILNKNKKDLQGLHKTKQEFYKDNAISKILGGPQSDMQDYVKSIGNSTREFIGESIPEYKNLMKQEFELYTALDDVATKFQDMNKIQQFINRHESALKALGYTVGFGYAGYEGVQAIAGQ